MDAKSTRMEPRAEKTCWSEIKHKIKELNPLFYENLAAVNPSDDLRLLIVKYPYGFKMSDEKAFYMPKGYEDHLEGNGFDKKAPLTFVLENQIEYYFDTSHNHVPWRIHSPGDFFPATVHVELEGGLRFHPRSIFTVTSGIRDITLLSLHSTTNDFYNLRRKYEIPVELSPANPLNHFGICKRIIEKEGIEWDSTVLLFAKEWRTEIDNNPSWQPFRTYMFENSLMTYRVHRSMIFLDHAIHDITRSLDFKFRPFAHEIIKQTIMISTGSAPGFRPATNNTGFPVDALSSALKSASRELLSYPIFMQASMMIKETRQEYIYNSITYNTMTQYEQKLNLNTYLNEIMMHLKDYLMHFREHLLTRGTVYADLYKVLEIIPCSTRGSSIHNIKKCAEMYEIDPSFWYPRDTLKLQARYGAPINAQFCKGFLGFRWTKDTPQP